MGEKYSYNNKLKFNLLNDDKKIIEKILTKGKSLIDYYGKEKGNKIWSRFTIHNTPINASWLDQVEIALGLYSRQCLGKDRIPDIETLREKTKAWNKAINKKKVKINWGFTIEKARNIFKY